MPKATTENRRRGRIVSDVGAFAIVPEWLIDSGVSDRALRTYVVLARYADADGVGFPSRTTLAKRVGKSVDTVDRALAELVDVGAIVVDRRDEQGRQTTNEYRLAFVRPRGRRNAADEGRTDAAPEGRTDAAQNENHRNENHRNERTDSAAVAAVEVFDPGKGKRIDGQNLPWNALVESTISHGLANEVRVGAALKSIRGEAWQSAQENGLTLDAVAVRWEEYEEALAQEIRRRVDWLKANNPNLTWGAEGVARWWSRIPASDATADLVAAAVARVRSAES
jgi:hypothetical protein